MKKTIRWCLSIPLSIVTWPVFALASSLFGFIFLMQLFVVIEKSFLLLGDEKEEAVEDIKYELTMFVAPLFLSFAFWFDYAKTGKFEDF